MNSVNRQLYIKPGLLSILTGIFGLMLVLNAESQTKIGDGTDDAQKDVPVVKRDPFWPVGYVPESLAKKAEEKDVKVVKSTVGNNWSAAMKKVVINGVSSRSNNEFYAVINGAVKSEGDTIAVNHEGTTYTWAVDKIQPPGSVKLRRISAR